MGAFFRFLLVGGSFSLGYALIMAALIRFAGAPPLATSIVIYLICIPLAFLAQKRLAFRADTTGRGAVWIYGGTQVVSLAFVSLITSRFVTRDFVLDTILYLVTAGVAAVISFLICRYIIFRTASDAQ